MGKAKPVSPRPMDAKLPQKKGKLDAQHKSPLGLYLKLNNVPVSAFAKAAGISFRTVTQWVDGSTLPSLPACYEIERLTKGLVPMEAWLGMPQARKMMAEWRKYQPEASKPELEDTDREQED